MVGSKNDNRVKDSILRVQCKSSNKRTSKLYKATVHDNGGSTDSKTEYDHVNKEKDKKQKVRCKHRPRVHSMILQVAVMQVRLRKVRWTMAVLGMVRLVLACEKLLNLLRRHGWASWTLRLVHLRLQLWSQHPHNNNPLHVSRASLYSYMKKPGLLSATRVY